jgi:hypothetical protein
VETRQLVLAALALSIASAAASAFVALRHPAPAPQAACTCDDAALRAEIADLRKQIAAGDPAAVKRLAARVSALENKMGAVAIRDDAPEPSATASAAAAPPPVIPPPPDLPKKPYKSFDLTTDKVTVRQDSTGALVVTNTDPALTGKTIQLIAHGEDGSTQQVSVVVPPPQ